MEYQIPFQGIALTPYSDTSPDGMLSACSMLEHIGGGLRPTLISGYREKLQDDLEDLKLIYQHTTASYRHLIFKASTGIYYGVEGSLSQLTLVSTHTDIKNIASIGNTLVVLSSDGLHYYLYADGNYKYIGTKPSELNIAFGLTGAPSTATDTENFTVKANASSPNIYTVRNVAETSDKVWQILNKEFIGQKICAPFFIRAAYRMHDGSHYMATPPVLLVPDTRGPRAAMYESTVNETTEDGIRIYTIKGKMAVHGIASGITYRLFSAGNLADWSDIITGVDVFMSPLVYPYDVNGEISTLGVKVDSYGIYLAPDSGEGYSYKQQPFHHYEGFNYFRLPWRADEDYINDLVAAAQFYKVASFTTEDYISKVNPNYDEVLRFIDGWNVNNLALQEALDDANDYQSHDTIIANENFIYNRRLHLYGIKRKLFAGFTPEVMWPHTTDGNTQYTIAVWINLPDGTTGIVKSVSEIDTLSPDALFFYYPDTNATRMVVYDAEGDALLDIPLEPHPFLNGAYHAWSRPVATSTTPALPQTAVDKVQIGNKLYVSEAENPYRFPLESIYTVGTGEILGLSTIATALSQGQFGQFPLMAFCSDGNYTLSVGGEGKYSTIHPMSRDVCTNPLSITQTDSEVLFVTAKGVMITSGASAQLLSGVLDGVPDSFTDECGCKTKHTGSPADFFAKCRIVYDYANKRFIFVTIGSALAWIYSFTSASWSTAETEPMQAILNTYPHSFIQMGGEIIKLDKPYPYEGEPGKGHIVTRPVKMESLQYKILHQIVLQGIFSRPQTIKVYGSQDGSTWHCLGTSQSRRIGRMAGRPFKYFRFAVLTELAPDENLTGLRVVYDVRAERRLR